jgi:hypothetical protein
VTENAHNSQNDWLSPHGQDGRDTPEVLHEACIRQGAYLPHWTRAGAIYTVAFRLADSLPQSVLKSWLDEREDILRTAHQMKRPLSTNEKEKLRFLFSERVDKYLDAGHGVCWLGPIESPVSLPTRLCTFTSNATVYWHGA